MNTYACKSFHNFEAAHIGKALLFQCKHFSHTYIYMVACSVGNNI